MRFLNLVITSVGGGCLTLAKIFLVQYFTIFASSPYILRNSCWTICLAIFAICLLPKVLPFKCTITSRESIAMLTIVSPMFTSSFPCSPSGGDEHNLSPSSPSWVMLHYKSLFLSTMYVRPFYKNQILVTQEMQKIDSCSMGQ